MGFSQFGGKFLVNLAEFQSEGDEVLDAEPFGTEVEDGVGYEHGRLFRRQSVLFRHCRDERLQGISQSLAALVERSLHYGFEKGFVAAEIFSGIAPQADDCRFDFGRRVERALADREQIFYVVPCLQQDRQYAVHFGPGLLGYPLSHLFLYHAHYLRDMFPVVEDFEEICEEVLYGKFPMTQKSPLKKFCRFSFRKSASISDPFAFGKFIRR